MEAAGLGLFMLSAAAFGTLIEHPASPVRQTIESGLVRRALMGLAMASTFIAIVYSPWGQRSGAHINPAATFTYWRLRRVASTDAAWYVAAQFAGGLAGILVAAAVLRGLLADPSVNYVATRPGPAGPALAFGAEVLMTFVLMSTVLALTNTPRINRYTGLVVGALVLVYITVEAPISGMSMNPARTLASAAIPGLWRDLWIYFVAPPLGMLLAAETFVRFRGRAAVLCAKLHHDNEKPCIFLCRWHDAAPAETEAA